MSSILIIGPSQSGKTTWAKAIIGYFRGDIGGGLNLRTDHGPYGERFFQQGWYIDPAEARKATENLNSFVRIVGGTPSIWKIGANVTDSDFNRFQQEVKEYRGVVEHGRKVPMPTLSSEYRKDSVKLEAYDFAGSDIEQAITEIYKKHVQNAVSRTIQEMLIENNKIMIIFDINAWDNNEESFTVDRIQDRISKSITMIWRFLLSIPEIHKGDCKIAVVLSKIDLFENSEFKKFLNKYEEEILGLPIGLGNLDLKPKNYEKVERTLEGIFSFTPFKNDDIDVKLFFMSNHTNDLSDKDINKWTPKYILEPLAWLLQEE